MKSNYYTNTTEDEENDNDVIINMVKGRRNGKKINCDLDDEIDNHKAKIVNDLKNYQMFLNNSGLLDADKLASIMFKKQQQQNKPQPLYNQHQQHRLHHYRHHHYYYRHIHY